jgi:probable rRNA maturation factor
MRAQPEKAIKFFFLTQDITLRNRNKLKKYLGGLIRKEGRKVGFVNYIFCSDNYLLEMNKQYLRHDYYTDIITFDLSVDPKIIEAEIYISIDRVNDNSKHLKIPFKSEIHRVIFHGALHLCGYRDKKESEIIRMREKENYYLANYK